MISSRLLPLFVLCCGVLAGSTLAAEPPLSDEQRSALKSANADPTLAPDLLLPAQDMAWWHDAKFGVFAHWGLNAIPARGEWHMFNDKVPCQSLDRRGPGKPARTAAPANCELRTAIG